MVWNDSSGVCEQESAQGQEGKKGINLTTEIIGYLIAQTYFIYLCIEESLIIIKYTNQNNHKTLVKMTALYL